MLKRGAGLYGVTRNSIMLLSGFIFIAMMTNTFVFGRPYSFSETHVDSGMYKRNTNDDDCQHTGQGKTLVTDDHGRVCKWKELDSTSNCCKVPVTNAFSCETCNLTTQCCYVYEHCVSCCMDPFKDEERTEFLRLRGTDELIALAQKGPFDYCRAMCRTSSRSIHSLNKYRNEEKHCYGGEAPAITMQMESPVFEAEMMLTKRSEETEPLPSSEPLQETTVIMSASSSTASTTSRAGTSSTSASVEFGSPTSSPKTRSRKSNPKPTMPTPSIPKIPESEKDIIRPHGEESANWNMEANIFFEAPSSSSAPISIDWILMLSVFFFSIITSLI